MNLSQKLPHYLTEKKNILRLIFFTAFFALIFINIYAPFGIKSFLNITKEWDLFLLSSLIILTGMMVVAISRIIMYQITKRGKVLSILDYLIWVGIEVVSMALFYTVYELFFLSDARPIQTAFGKSILNTSLVLLLPYSVLWLYFSWLEKSDKLTAISENPDILPTKTFIPFRDEKGTLRISIKPNDILYIQGSDNYSTIYYHTNEKTSKHLLRNTLKKLEKELTIYGIIRCHRSYLINIDKIKLVRKEKDGLFIELDTIPPTIVPISKTYTKEVFQSFGYTE